MTRVIAVSTFVVALFVFVPILILLLRDRVSRRARHEHGDVSEETLRALEVEKSIRFPDGLRSWLLQEGFGDLGEDLSIRTDWLSVIDRGELDGHVMFGQDVLGNFYAFDPEGGAIHYICRSEPVFARLAAGFGEFIRELERRDYDIVAWVETVPTDPYDWST